MRRPIVRLRALAKPRPLTPGLTVSLGMLVLLAIVTPEAIATDIRWPAILKVQADDTLLTIEGFHLSGGSPPRVWLGGDELTVVSHAPELVLAELPSGLAPADYLLRLVVDRFRVDSFVVSLADSNRLVTPDGIVIESTGAGVRIAAAGSVITLDGLGNIMMQSAGSLTLNASGPLNLRGDTVNVQSARALNFDAGQDMSWQAPNMTLRSDGTMRMEAAEMNLQFSDWFASGRRAQTNLTLDWELTAHTVEIDANSGVAIESAGDVRIDASGQVLIKGSNIPAN